MEGLVRILLEPTETFLKTLENIERKLREFRLSLDTRNSSLSIDGAFVEESFVNYSDKVGEFLGSEKKLKLLVAKSREEWVDHNIQKFGREYPESAQPLLQVLRAAAMNRISPQSLDSLIKEDPAAVLGYLQRGLKNDTSFILDMQGVTYGQRVGLNLPNFQRQLYASLYVRHVNGRSLNHSTRQDVQSGINGLIKFITSHETVHGHFSHFGEMAAALSRQYRQFTLDLFRMIYELGDENKQIYTALSLEQDEHVTNELYACIVFGHALDKFQKSSYQPNVNPEELKPLPKHIREFMASYRGAFPHYVSIVIDESLADFVAEQVLRDDREYRSFRITEERLEHDRPENTLVGYMDNARKVGLPLVRVLHNRFGNDMFDMLRQRLPQSQEELARPQLYITNSGFSI